MWGEKSVNGQIPARAEFGRVVSNWKCKNLRPSIKLNQGRIVSSRDWDLRSGRKSIKYFLLRYFNVWTVNAQWYLLMLWNCQEMCIRTSNFLAFVDFTVLRLIYWFLCIYLLFSIHSSYKNIFRWSWNSIILIWTKNLFYFFLINLRYAFYLFQYIDEILPREKSWKPRTLCCKCK